MAGFYSNRLIPILLLGFRAALGSFEDVAKRLFAWRWSAVDDVVDVGDAQTFLSLWSTKLPTEVGNTIVGMHPCRKVMIEPLHYPPQLVVDLLPVQVHCLGALVLHLFPPLNRTLD